MKKVLIIDDEPIVKIAIKSIVEWEKQGFDVDLEASNGKQALKILSEVTDIQLIVTDINMPIMDGLEFLTELNEMKYDIPIVVLSGFNDYNLVRQAFKLGALDYILKSEMTSDNLLAIFTNVIRSHELKVSVIQKEKIKMKNVQSTKSNYIKDMIVKGQINYDKDVFEALGIKILEHCNIVVCKLLVDDYKQIINKYQNQSLILFTNSVINSIEQIIKDMGSSEIVSIAPDDYLLILCLENKSEARIRNEVNEVLTSIRYILQNYINVNITVGISNIHNGIGQLKNCVDEANDNANLRFLVGKGKNIYSEDTIKYNETRNSEEIVKENNIIHALIEFDLDLLLKELHQMFQAIYQLKLRSKSQSYIIYMEIVFIICRYLKEIEQERLRSYINESDIYEVIIDLETLAEINDYMIGKITILYNKLDKSVNENRNRSINKAMQYIHQNYPNKDITLATVSEYAGISPCHLSVLFTKQLGKSFKTYLTEVRIEKAKELIRTTNFKIYEISDQIGYSNVEHFSRIFKKTTGISPNCF